MPRSLFEIQHEIQEKYGGDPSRLAEEALRGYFSGAGAAGEEFVNLLMAMSERAITLSHLIERGCYTCSFTSEIVVATRDAAGSWRLSSMGCYNSGREPEYRVSDDGRIWRYERSVAHVDCLMIFYILPKAPQ